jgi:hypothetical protein
MDEEVKTLDTRGYLNLLIDHNFAFGNSKPIEDAIELIKDIPSITLLLNIAYINLALYQNDSAEKGQEMQNMLIKAYVAPGSEIANDILTAYITTTKNKQWPTVFYRYSNLLFYELIFTNYNRLAPRELTITETVNMVRAYLIINEKVNERIKIDENEFEIALESNHAELIILPQFIYQKDYTSNVDYTNQITRCLYFFNYLENEKVFKNHIREYYSGLGVENAAELCNKLISLSSNYISGMKNPIFSVVGAINEVHNKLLMTLSIDPSSFVYRKDESMTQFRNQMFVLTPNNKFLLLDINFLIDSFYKAQVFAVNNFLKSKGITNFLSKKGEFFMEKIYLDFIMQNCFPTAERFNAIELLKKDKNPLTDFIVVKGNNVLLIEFKDTLLSSIAKNSGDQDKVFKALDIKFVNNEEGDPKGIYQLINAIRHLKQNPSDFQHLCLSQNKMIFPIVIYTDNSFGYDGMNKVYKEKFDMLLKEEHPDNFETKDVTFINLSFFELNEDYLKTEKLDIFNLITNYHTHIQDKNFSSAPFEVFATMYRKTHVPEKLEVPSLFRDALIKIINFKTSPKQ